MFAGNFTGRTQTLPLAIYIALESNLDAAKALSVVLVMVAFGLLLLLHARGGAGAAAAPGAAPGASPGARHGATET
jgi:molybdate transport system permease protein